MHPVTMRAPRHGACTPNAGHEVQSAGLHLQLCRDSRLSRFCCCAMWLQLAQPAQLSGLGSQLLGCLCPAGLGRLDLLCHPGADCLGCLRLLPGPLRLLSGLLQHSITNMRDGICRSMMWCHARLDRHTETSACMAACTELHAPGVLGTVAHPERCCGIRLGLAGCVQPGIVPVLLQLPVECLSCPAVDPGLLRSSRRVSMRQRLIHRIKLQSAGSCCAARLCSDRLLCGSLQTAEHRIRQVLSDR